MNDIITSRLDKIDSYVEQAVEADDPYIVLEQIKMLMEAEELVGMAKAKFFYVLHSVWGKFSMSKQERMENIIYQSLNVHPHTVKRYITMWEYKQKLPEHFQDKPVRYVEPLTKALSQGYDLDEYWDRLDDVTNLPEMYEVLREVKGKEPRKGRAIAYLEPDGSIVIWKNNQAHQAGYLDVFSTDDVVVEFINKLTDSVGVIRK